VLEKLRQMLPPSPAHVMRVFVLALAIATIITLPCDAQTAASGVFVSYSAQATGASITLQEAASLRVYSVRSDAVVQARDSGGDWQTITFADLMQGEPVSLHLSSAGIVDRIQAQFDTILTRLVAFNNGFVVTTSGSTYKLVGQAANFPGPLDLGTYLRLRVDEKESTAFDIAASQQPFAGAAQAQPISVTFVVTVPANSPPTDIVYIAADAQNWIPNGVRMSPLSANRWTTTLTLGKGTSIKYKYTRGSWASAESNAAGIQIPNRSLVVMGADGKQSVNDTVIRWSDLPS